MLSGIRTWQVFALALALRLPIAWLRPLEAHAENIKSGFTLGLHGYLGDPFAIPTGPTAHVAPAYPALVAAVRSITPSDSACMHTLSVIMAVVSACNIAALLPVSRALRLPRAAGTIAALLWLMPVFAWIEVSAEFETPLTVAALLALMTLVARTIEREPATIGTGARLGLAVGLAAYVTPTVLPAITFATLAAARLARWSIRSVLAVGVGAAVLFTVAVSPYTLRNHQVFGEWFLMRDDFGLELAISNGPNARATKDENTDLEGSVLNRHPSASRTSAALVKELGEVHYNHLMQRTAVAWIKANPAEFMALVAQRAGYMLLPRSLRWSQTIIAGLISMMTIAGCVLLWDSRYRFGIQCLTAAVVGYLLVYLLIEHDIRYMYPALFLESLIAGSFLAVLGRIRDRDALSGALTAGTTGTAGKFSENVASGLRSHWPR
ncbi:MAG: hypothetical protein JOZ34_04460 [Gammaproteobacteria bacterium]|nr:hypothetical protein [Gammaproteobacteria bacterium]